MLQFVGSQLSNFYANSFRILKAETKQTPRHFRYSAERKLLLVESRLFHDDTLPLASSSKESAS